MSVHSVMTRVQGILSIMRSWLFFYANEQVETCFARHLCSLCWEKSLWAKRLWFSVRGSWSRVGSGIAQPKECLNKDSCPFSVFTCLGFLSEHENMNWRKAVSRWSAFHFSPCAAHGDGPPHQGSRLARCFLTFRRGGGLSHTTESEKFAASSGIMTEGPDTATVTPQHSHAGRCFEAFGPSFMRLVSLNLLMPDVLTAERTWALAEVIRSHDWHRIQRPAIGLNLAGRHAECNPRCRWALADWQPRRRRKAAAPRGP